MFRRSNREGSSDGSAQAAAAAAEKKKPKRIEWNHDFGERYGRGPLYSNDAAGPTNKGWYRTASGMWTNSRPASFP